MSDYRGDSAPRDYDPRPRRDHGGAWVGAVVLIAIGAIFLARNLGVEMPRHWWALFLFIPALGALMAAGRNYSRYGEVNGAVLGPLFASAVLVAVALIFLFDLEFYFNVDWGMVWPVILILIGVGLLLRNFRRR